MDTRKRPVLRVLNTLMACLGVAAGGLVICGLLLAYVPPPAAPAAGTADPEPPAVEEPTPQAEESTAPEASDEEPEEAAPAKMTRRDTYDEAGGLLWSHVYQYDDQGRMNGVTSYNAAGEQTGFVEVLYDAEGLQIQNYSWIAGTDGKAGMVIPMLYRYDASGRLEREEHYSDDNELDLYLTYQYDADGQIIRSDRCSPDGTLISFSLYTYNADNKVTRIDDYAPNGRLETYSEWTYNAAGERMTYVSYQAGGTEIFRWTYAYDEDGNAVQMEMTEYGMTTIVYIQYE